MMPTDPSSSASWATLTLRDLANQALYHTQPAPRWMGVPVDKCAQDLLVYQEIITATQPRVILETGAFRGGSALYFADICALLGHGHVISVDLSPPPGIEHPRLTFVAGDSVAPETVELVHRLVDGQPAFVLLDSDHSQAHVLAELDAYSALVPVGGYLVVEDTNINNHPVCPDFGPGPWEAVHEWLPRHPEFVVDTEVEAFITFAPNGYLRRVN